jgi:hypothetical protein
MPLTISFNGKDLFTASDEAFKGAGKVALWTKADSVTRFGALTIESCREHGWRLRRPTE